jgi:hypothetical protein
MLFVSPIRARVFSHESAGVSASINAILEKVGATPGINRKQLAEQLAPVGAEPADLERAKHTLASDLHWLVSEGYVIEFNDGSLDLPRTKSPVAVATEQKPSVAGADMPAESVPEAQPVGEQPDAVSEAQPAEPAADLPPVEEKPADAAVPVAEDTIVAATAAEGEEVTQPAPEETPEAVTTVPRPGA